MKKVNRFWLLLCFIPCQAGKFISFENKKSIKAKTNYAVKQGLKGIMVWQISLDKTNDLIQSIDQSLPKGKEFIVYLPNYVVNGKRGYQISQLETLLKKGTKITSVVYGFAKPNADGTVEFDNQKLDLGRGTDSDGNIKKFAAFKKNYPNVKLFLSFGGWGYKNEFYKAANNGNLKRLAFNCVALLPEHFDGIDIDWEFQSDPEREMFNEKICQFADYINQAIEKRTQKTFFSLAVKTNTHFHNRFKSFKKLTEKVDWINLMAYNYEGPDWSEITGHNAPLYSPDLPSKRTWKTSTPKFESVDTSINAVLKMGVAPNKLVLGVPFYGRAFKDVKAGNQNDGLYQLHGGPAKKDAIISYSRLVGKVPLSQKENGSFEFTYYWDDVSKVPYLYSNS